MKYVCRICGYIYDEEKEKIPFSKLSDDWTCPLCGADKSQFALEEIKTDIQSETAFSHQEKTEIEGEELVELSYGQLAALFSNLQRGCEKQYKGEESSHFKELAEYFTNITPASSMTEKQIFSSLNEEIDLYGELSKISKAYSDRGALRAITWGEKVTRILYGLLQRYLKEGEKMFSGEKIYLCTVCGFVYVGKEAPSLCPVCKVPSWKFETIEGREKI